MKAYTTKSIMDKADDISGVTSDMSTWYKGMPKDDGTIESHTMRMDWIGRRKEALKAAGKGQFEEESSPGEWMSGSPKKVEEALRDNLAPWDIYDEED